LDFIEFDEGSMTEEVVANRGFAASR